MEKTNKKYIIIVVVSILILSIGVSLAYWTVMIKGEGTPMTFKAAELKIVFTDTASIQAVSIEPGWSETKTFTVKNESDTNYEYNIIMKNLLNTFVTEGYLQYKITSDSGYDMPDYLDIPKSETPTDTILAYKINIEPGVTQTYTIEFIYRNTEEDQSDDMGKQLSGTLAIAKGTDDPNALYTKILADKTTRPGKRIDFSSVLTTDNTKTLYTEDGNYTEGGKTVYYFAGNATDNWVYFGGFYWRIIRINEDNSVRLLYVGESTDTTSAFIQDKVAYNSTYDDTMYVGYMYGTTGSLANNRNNTTNSTIKTVIDNWYASNLNTNYNSYVSQTAIYCNDRSGDEYAASGYMRYAAHRRLNGYRPSYKCGNNPSGTLYSDNSNADKFTKSTTTGNGKLTYPIALMTADEVGFAGGVNNKNAGAWYYYNSDGGSAVGDRHWWTMTPYSYTVSYYTLVFDVIGSNNPGFLNNNPGKNAAPAVRPVLSLKSCVTWTEGDGTHTNPYKVSLSSSCSSSIN